MRAALAFDVTVDDADAALARIIGGSHQMSARADILFDRVVIEENVR